jgi:phosphoribosyl 1,2-cyclic phosphate phosphodiesterase
MVRCFAGADLLVCDCLKREPHPTHAHLAMALELQARSGARRMVLTHLDKTMDYATLSRELPQGVAVGYDGLEWRS